MSENRPPEYRDKSLEIREKNLENREGDCALALLGRYKNVILSDAELADLQTELPTKWQHYINRLSEYMASTGKQYKSHLATIRRWAADDGKQSGMPDYSDTGLLHCGNCHTPKQCRVTLFDKEKLMPCNCKCRQDYLSGAYPFQHHEHRNHER